MAWDDAPPDHDLAKGGMNAAKGGAWDAAPPDADIVGPKWADLPGNIIPDAVNTLKGSAQTAGRIAKGVYDLPSDLTETARQELTGGNPLETPIAQDVKTVGSGVLDTAKAIPGQIKDLGSKESWVQHPVGNALTVASLASPFLGGEGAAARGVRPPAAIEGSGFVPREAIAKAAPLAEMPESKMAVPDEEKIPDLEPMGGGKQGEVPPSRMPPDPNAPKADEPPPAAAPEAKPDPLKDVRDFINSKAQKMDAKGGWPEKLANYLKEESTNLGAKDLGLQGRQVQTMGPGYKGLEKGAALVDYAREKGYLDPGLSDATRRAKITANMDKAGDQMDAVRNIAEKRGAPPYEEIKAAVQQELEKKYGSGTEKATSEIANVMDDINKAPPTFTGMSELATKLNHSATKVKDLGQHPGPTTDAANIVSRINNDAIRKHLNPQESELYTQSLRDYGAHKKLEQATAGAGRRNMTARSNQRGPIGRLMQEALDRGGYRLGGNVANKVANTVLKNPGKIKTLPQFFEELAHQSNESLDEELGINGMAKGGIVPHDVRDWVNARGC